MLRLNFLNGFKNNSFNPGALLNTVRAAADGLKEKFFRLFFRGDKYLIIEILNHYVQITILKANLEKKEIYISKNWVRTVPDFRASGVLEEVSLLLKKIRKLEKYRIILSLDSSFATTIYSSVSLVRSNQKEAINEADLDNLISQAIWRFFDRNRLKVSQKMGIDDVDVLLSDVRIRGIKLDGHKIVNPIGFKAKSVEIFFSQTFISRELMRGVRDLLPKENIALMTEAGTALSHILHRILGKSDFFAVNLFPNETSVFYAAKGRLAHLDNFGWGENDLTNILHRYLKVDGAVARSIMENYSANNASQSFSRRLENILIKELQIFSNGLESLADEATSEVYINPFFNMPPLIFTDRFHSRIQKGIKLFPLSTKLITEKFGYELQFKKSLKIKNLPSLLAAFLEINFLPQNDKMSHLANRRVRWLVS